MDTGSDIYTKLKDDHQSAISVFNRLAETTTTDATKRKALFEELRHSLKKHSEAEDRVFYAELLKHDATRSLIRDGQQEHQRVETLLDELDRMDQSNPQWSLRLQTLKGMVEHHVQQEEGEIFAKARTILSAQQAEDLGRQFTQAKTRETLTQARETAESYAPEASAKVQEAGARVYQETQRLADTVKERGSSMLQDQQHFIASQVESVAGALHRTAEQLGTEDQEALAQYTGQAAAGLERLSHSLRDQDLNALVGQVEDFARRQPTAFIGSAALLGFLAARFLKSSAERRQPSSSASSYNRESVTGSSAATTASSPAYSPPTGMPSDHGRDTTPISTPIHGGD